MSGGKGGAYRRCGEFVSRHITASYAVQMKGVERDRAVRAELCLTFTYTLKECVGLECSRNLFILLDVVPRALIQVTDIEQVSRR